MRRTSVVVLLTLAACNAGSNNASLPQASRPATARTITRAASPIQHVVFIVQENRSFNNMFLGFPGATTQNYGYDTKGGKITLQAVDLATDWDIQHASRTFFAACNGRGKIPGTKCRMNGWNNEVASIGAPRNFAYSYVPENQIAQYWEMAQQYVLADNMFSSNIDGSFIAHQYSVAAYADRAADYPKSDWGCPGGVTDTIPTFTNKRKYGKSIQACFDIPTLGNEADAAGVSWRYYTGALNSTDALWSAYQADSRIYGQPDWTADVISPQAQFLTDIGNGYLANITWITPKLQDSDHPGLLANGGPAWVSSIVNAVGKSPYWKSSAIFIIWDDWGGWFDPVKPPFVDYDGLGFRIPLIMISPYSPTGRVTHTQYEIASVLRYIEDNFGLAPLAASDARANDPANDPNAFDYAQKPRRFHKFATLRPPRIQSGHPTRLGDD
ncbi:MAG: hypothetical protein JO263_03605 [Candidatus Eremiobacteraeota bacterium]|nr:hypothetical protein [Candidatus Eremiobacteraeota bacterium]